MDIDEQQIIAGAGGGKGGGGGSAKVAKDDLDSKQIARIIDVLSEGEIEGLVTGNSGDDMLKSVFLDNTQIIGDDGSDNFDRSDSAFEFRTGTQAQTYTQNVGSANQSEVQVNSKVVKDSPITRSITDTDLTHIRVTIGTPALQIQEDDGDIKGHTIGYEIQVSYAGGAYASVVTSTITGRTADLYQRRHLITLTQAPPVNVRVLRTTESQEMDGDAISMNDDFYWYSYTEKIVEKTTFPNSALMAMKISSEQFPNIPQRLYHIKGIKVKIPSNGTVNSTTGAITYSGTWNGNFGSAVWTSDPLWCLYDLLINKRYGLGQHLDESKLDKWSFYTASQYAGESVSDGDGGTEPRFSCNVCIQSETEAYKLINQMCSVFRAMPYWSAGTLAIAQDAPDDYMYIFNQSNVSEGRILLFGFKFKTKTYCRWC